MTLLRERRNHLTDEFLPFQFRMCIIHNGDYKEDFTAKGCDLCHRIPGELQFMPPGDQTMSFPPALHMTIIRVTSI